MTYDKTSESDMELFFEKVRNTLSKLSNNELPTLRGDGQPRKFTTGNNKRYTIDRFANGIDYEILYHAQSDTLSVEIQFENDSYEVNSSRLKHTLEKYETRLREKIEQVIVIDDKWGKNWTRIYVHCPYKGFTDESAHWVAECMVKMYFATDRLQEYKLTS